MTNDISKAPTWFVVTAAVALLWNLLGVAAYLMQMTMSAEDIAALPAAEQALYANVPAWATAAFATAVFAGTVGCVLLLMRRSLANVVLIISLIGILVQMTYNVAMSEAIEVYGPGGMVMPALVLLIGIALVVLGRKAANKGWLH